MAPQVPQGSFISASASPSISLAPVVFNVPKSVMELLLDGILFLKRTFQPSLLRRKRKHGFLVRAATNNGNKTLNRRRTKKRRYICA